MSTSNPQQRRRSWQRAEPEAVDPSPLSLLRHQQPYSLRSVDVVAPSPPPESDSLRDVLAALRRSWWIIAISAIVAVAAGVAIAQTKPKTYEAGTYLLLNGNGYASAIGGGYNPADPQQQQATVTGLLTPSLLAASAREAGISPTASYSVNPTAAANSTVIQLVATTSQAQTAPALANATAANLTAFWARNNQNQLHDAKRVLHRQITLAPNATERRAVVAQLNNLNDLSALANQQIQIIQRAGGPGALVSRNTARDGAIALVLGLLFGSAVALLRKRKPAPAV